MHSKAPGDNKLMVDTRNKFLSKGYYQTLLNALCKQIISLCNTLDTKHPVIADAGCGEGYYTAGICSALSNGGFTPNLLGVDISKEALTYAAKRLKQLQVTTAKVAVASVFDLPIANNSCDILMELFAPYSGDEYRRVLKKDGMMLIVIPAENHLYELKQAVYDNPYKNEVKAYELDGFELISKEHIKETIFLENSEDIKNLFLMTPYYYKTSKSDTDRLLALESLTTTIEFELLSYKVIK